MNRFIVFLITVFTVCIAVTGCTPGQIKADVEQKVAHDLAVKIGPTAIPDLQNQIDKASAANPPDVKGAQCAQATIQLITDLQNASSGAQGSKCSSFEFLDPSTGACKVGLFTSLEAQRLAASTPVETFKLPAYWIEGCAVVVHDAKLSFAEFLAQFGIALAPIAGEANVLAGAAALKAGAAQLRAAEAAAHP